MFRHYYRTKPVLLACRAYSIGRGNKVWVVTDGALESSLQALTLGRQLANGPGSRVELKKVVASKNLQLLPPILQKYMIDWNKSKSNETKLPWYLSSSSTLDIKDGAPDYIVASGQDAVPACLYLSNLNKQKGLSIYLGYPNIPFINFDQVILPRYEANAKMAALGPLARQKNGIITPAPLLDTNAPTLKNTSVPFENYSTVVVGGHSPSCRWYSEDAINLAENIKRMVKHLNDHVVIVYTDRTPQLVKDKMTKALAEETKAVFMWDSTDAALDTMDKLDMYENIIHASDRVILTADLDYASAHAASRK
ncbi:mitochondrial fission protein ELM1-like protein [Blakeslea trispora]|nr:mitochondrial fission protein ELM1-like protein [Blakeslea trispora]